MRQSVLRRCLECGFLYPGTPDDDQKCEGCSERATQQMLGGVLFVGLIITCVLLAGFFGTLT